MTAVPAVRPGIDLDLHALVGLQARAPGLGLSPGARVRSHQAGGYVSVYRGRGMDFDQVRPYQAGDDPRTMDWRALARSGRAYTKLFREERERPVLFLVDQSPGMFFGTRERLKAVRAGEAAALLAWAAAANGDRVGGLVAGAWGHRESPPRLRRAGVIALLDALGQGHRAAVAAPGVEALPLAPLLARVEAAARPGSLVFLVSDLRGLDREAERALARLGRHLDLVAVRVYDPLEDALPAAGPLVVSDGRRRLTVVGTGVRRNYRADREAWLQDLGRVLARCRAHALALATDAPLVETLRRGLHARAPRHVMAR